MKTVIAMGAALLLLDIGIIGCSKTAEGAKQDAASDVASVKQAGDQAAISTEKATDRAVAATEAAAHNAAVATKEEAERASVTTARASKNASDALTLTPKVKFAIVNDSELNNTKNTINVESGGDVVRLEGHVLTREMKQRAGSIAVKVVKTSGATNAVKNDLKVTGQ